MYRYNLIEKETGKIVPAWHYISKDLSGYFKDLSLTEKLDESKYEIVENRGGETIPTPYQLFGIECEKGWFPLIQPIVDYIDKFNEDKPDDEKIYITQIKEKYGTLRIYVSHGTEELFNMIDEAEDKSASICEFCGSNVNVGQTTGWIMTICHDCLKKHVKSRGYSQNWIQDEQVYEVFPDDDKPDGYVGTEKEYLEGKQ